MRLNIRNENNEREAVKVEPFFEVVLDDLSKSVDSISDAVSSDKNLTRLMKNIKWAILNELAPTNQTGIKQKTPIGKFNATHTAFDVLVDYQFGGDKQAALEYLKTL